MRRDDYTRTIGTHRGRNIALGLMVVAAIASITYFEPDGTNTLGEQGAWVARSDQPAGAVGTAGADEAEGADNNSGPPAISPPPVVQDARAAITGEDDWQELVGQRLSLTLPLEAHLNDGAFWAGEGEDKILVVVARDRRDEAMRQRGEPSGLDASDAERATLTGTVRRIPHAEAMYSWRLTNHDVAQLSRRPVYLHVDSIGPASS